MIFDSSSVWLREQLQLLDEITIHTFVRKLQIEYLNFVVFHGVYEYL